MISTITAIRDAADAFVLWILTPLAVYILINGMDDMFVNTVWLYRALRRWLFGMERARLPSQEQLASAAQKRIAIFVPLWHEHDVIGDMLAHNVAAIRYRNYDIFAGAYPNDPLTLEAVRAAEARFPNVHLAVCPHDGPTSKADCLNWIYQRMLLYEESAGVRFEVVMTHDAEDVIHPDALRWSNFYCGEYGFVQIPVLALSTPLLNFIHGTYCDEFAEFQSRDLPVRNVLGGFVPSAGVGTAYSREAIEALASSASNRVFDPGCLTEDYENGLRLHELGFRQMFMPITKRGTFIATREYFPGRMSAAIAQRSRWVIGIALQGWERHGWRGGLRQTYWLWRDRRGLIANPLSLLTNLVCAYSFFTGLWTRITPSHPMAHMLELTLLMYLTSTAIRVGCTTRIYGWRFSVLAPARAVAANVINTAAVIKAVHRFTTARIRGEALVWVKTEHAYPSRVALLSERRRIGEILVGSSYISQADLDAALATQPPGLRLGEHLVALGKLTDDELYEALSLQQQLPLAVLPDEVPRRVVRALPANVAKQWKVLPFRVEAGRLDVASPELPGEAMESALRTHTALEVRFHLITPLQYRELESRLEP